MLYVTEREAFQNLAHAIIVQAAKDYQEYYGTYRIEQERIESFFRSEWFTMLTDLDPETLINHLNRDIQRRRQQWKL